MWGPQTQERRRASRVLQTSPVVLVPPRGVWRSTRARLSEAWTGGPSASSARGAQDWEVIAVRETLEGGHVSVTCFVCGPGTWPRGWGSVDRPGG